MKSAICGCEGTGDGGGERRPRDAQPSTLCTPCHFEARGEKRLNAARDLPPLLVSENRFASVIDKSIW